MKHTFEDVTENLKTDKGLNLKQTLYFHAFNPNGLYAKKKELDDRVSELVDKKLVPPGWILAYGSFDDFHTERLIKMINQKAYPNRIKVKVLLDSIKERNEKVNKLISEKEVTSHD